MTEPKITRDDLRYKIDQLNRAASASIKSNRLEVYVGTAVAAAAAIFISYRIGKCRGRR